MSGGNDKLDREIEAFLGDESRVAALYRRLPKDEPDAKLDAAILAQARASVASRRARPRWLPAMSAAAAIVLAAGLAYRVGPQVWNEHSAVSEKAEQRVAAPAAVQPPAEPNAPAEAPAAAPIQTETVSSNAVAPQQAQLERHAEADKLQTQKRKLQDQKTTSSAIAKQTAQQPTQDAARDTDNAAGAASGALREQPQRAKTLASPPRLDSVPTPSAETSSAPALSAAKPSAPEPTAFPSAAGAAYTPATAPPPPAAPAARAPVRETAQSVADVEATLYPEHWIANIQKMLKDGHRDDAIRNLKAFRKHYPDYTLPDDLRDLK